MKQFIVYAYKIRIKVALDIFKIFLFIIKIKFLLYTTFCVDGWLSRSLASKTSIASRPRKRGCESADSWLGQK